MPASRCPHCDIPLTQAERDRGRCPSCGQNLDAPVRRPGTVDSEEPYAAPAASPDDLELAQEPRAMPQARYTGRPFLSPLFTILFGVGTVLIVVFVFLPLLDSAYVSRQKTLLWAAEAPIHRLEQELNQGAQPGKPGEPPSKEKQDQIQEKLKAARSKFDGDKRGLDEAIERAQVHAALAGFWYRWGMLVGYVLLAIGSIGYLHPQQPTTRRVVGAVIICAEVILVFLASGFIPFFTASITPGPK